MLLFSISVLFVLIFNPLKSIYSQNQIKKINQKLSWQIQDTIIIKQLFTKAEDTFTNQPDTALAAIVKATNIAETIHANSFLSGCYGWLAYLYEGKGEWQKAISFNYKALEISLKLHENISTSTILNNLAALYDNMGQKQKALDLYHKSLYYSYIVKDSAQIAIRLNNIALLYFNQGKLEIALDLFKKSLKISVELGKKEDFTTTLMNIGNIYKGLDEHESALMCYQGCLQISNELNNKYDAAAAISGIGEYFESIDDDENAFKFHKMALKIREEINDIRGLGFTKMNLGNLFLKQNFKDKARKYFLDSELIFNDIHDPWGLSIVNNYLGKLDFDKGNYNNAQIYFEKAYNYSLQLGHPNLIAEAAKNLSELYRRQFNWEAALKMSDQYYSMRDSVVNTENLRLAIVNKYQYEFDRKEIQSKAEQDKELVRQRLIRNSTAGFLIFSLIFSIFILIQRNRISQEKRKSENLLLNILPEDVANELKLNGKTEAKVYEHVSILFTDFKDFTEFTAKLSPHELLDELNVCFEKFDHICQKYQLEKIKTIGDSYMAAGGLKSDLETSAANTVTAALEMQNIMKNRKIENERTGKLSFEMRCGIHTGPVIAGVVGVNKFQYDIWGDTVNTASRMESNGEVGKVNISESTYNAIRSNKEFAFEERSLIKVKGKGDTKMWFVERGKKSVA